MDNVSLGFKKKKKRKKRKKRATYRGVRIKRDYSSLLPFRVFPRGSDLTKNHLLLFHGVFSSTRLFLGICDIFIRHLCKDVRFFAFKSIFGGNAACLGVIGIRNFFRAIFLTLICLNKKMYIQLLFKKFRYTKSFDFQSHTH